MKVIIMIIFLVHMGTSEAQINLDSLRLAYPQAITNKNLCQKYIEKLEGNSLNPIEIAYLGAFQAIWAHHTKNPMDKLSTFKRGKKNLEAAVAQFPQNIEIRFLRLSIQQNSPRILGYKKNFEEDKRFVLNNTSKIENRNLENLIFNYFKNSDDLNSKNKSKTKPKLAN